MDSASDHLLACARIAQHEHRHTRIRDLANLRDYPLHGGRLSNETFKPTRLLAALQEAVLDTLALFGVPEAREQACPNERETRALRQ